MSATDHDRFSVVVADDVADVRFLVRSSLEGSGRFDVVAEAADGHEAVALAKEHQPDLVLLDLSMPRMDGMQALPLIQDVAPDTKVVVLSSFPAKRMEGAVRSRGALGYLQKGLPPRQLVDQLLEMGGFMEVVQQALERAGVTLASELRSAGLARRFVDETLSRWNCGDLFDTVALLVSELVTNAVIHAGSAVEVAVSLTPDVVRVDVFDDDTTPPAPRDAADTDTSGRGMAILDAYASSWGVDTNDAGKSVWFEVPRPDRRAS